MDDDIFRGSGNVVPSTEVDLGDDWDAMRGLPKYLYAVYRGYGCDSMEMWRLHCLGQKRVWIASRLVDHWVYKHDRPIWRGPKVTETTAFRETLGKTFITSKTQAFQTVDEAIAKFAAIWKEHVEVTRSNMKSIENSISRYQAERARLYDEVKDHEAGPSFMLLFHLMVMAKDE